MTEESPYPYELESVRYGEEGTPVDMPNGNEVNLEVPGASKNSHDGAGEAYLNGNTFRYNYVLRGGGYLLCVVRKEDCTDKYE